MLIYRGLLFRHPLRGSAVYAPDPDDDDRFVFGEKALYIEHPTDIRNRPKKPFLTSTILGREMQALFRRAFIDGLHHPDQRPTAEEWEHALLRLHDQVLRCSNPRCEARAYIFGYGKTSAWDCAWCGATLAGPTQLPMLLHYKPSGEPGRMEFDFQVIGWPKRTLHAWHVEVGCFPGPGADAKVFATLQWEQTTNSWRLENATIADLRALKNGQSLTIAPGESLTLDDGMQILCGAGAHLRVIVVRMYKR